MAETNDAEVARRHRAASLAVQLLVTVTLLLVVLAYAGVRLPLDSLPPAAYGTLWIVVLFLGLGAVAFRRSRFNATRLQDVADLGGPTALLATLQSTTLLLAALAALAAVIGFVLYSVWREPTDMVKAGVVALVVLFYAYPRRAAWRKVVEASQRPGGLTGAAEPKGTTA